MSYKTIAVYLARRENVESMMGVAIPLAESFEAHLSGFHVASAVPMTTTISAQVPPKVAQQYVDLMLEDAKAIAAGFADSVKSISVPSEWREYKEPFSDVSLLHAITEQARCADLVIIGQTQSEQRVGELAADIILGAGRPVLIVPQQGKFGAIFGLVVIGWDGSREAARAAFDALPFLKQADAVKIITVGESGDAKNIPNNGSELAKSLARHGVNAEVVMLKSGDESAGEALLTYTSDQDGDLLVMGCYGHSRLREYLFGGATRYVLKNMITPTFMSN